MPLSIRVIAALVAVSCFISAPYTASCSLAAEPIKTFDGKYDVSRIHATVVYFVPRDRTPLADWKQRVAYYCRRIERFHQRELDGQSQLATTIRDQPFISSKNSTELRSGDRNFIFFQTLGEVETRLGDSLRPPDAFPILIVLSDINWRELDDFHRLRSTEGELQFEGQIIGQRHFPGAASGGARAMYIADRGIGWGLVSGDGWRVPYSGSDSVVYHEGVGHAIGLPHPEPADGSVMSLAQYQYWLNQTWIDEAQKNKLGWTSPEDACSEKSDLFSLFTAIPEPPVPRPGEDVFLNFTWPDEAKISQLTIGVQTSLFGPWQEIPVAAKGSSPERIPIARFDRATPVSYRVNALLEDGQDVELWGYFQVREAPDTAPLPPVSAETDCSKPAVAPVRWNETVDLLPLAETPR